MVYFLLTINSIFVIKLKTMKFLAVLSIVLFVASCGMKVPYNEEIKTKYDLNESNIKKVQFFTSSTIVLERKNSQENKGTTDNGALVTNENSVENRVIIPVHTKCVFEKFENGNTDVIVRFEVGDNKVLRFSLRKNSNTGKYYLKAKSWDSNKGGEIDYGNLTYYATPESGSAFLLVVTKKLKKVKRKDRVVKGMKV